MKIPPPKGRKRKPGKWFKYDFAFMRKVVYDYLDGYQSMHEVAKRYNINRGCLMGWIIRQREGKEPFDKVSLSEMITEQPQTTANEDFQKQNEELIKKLAEANLKITGLEIMIDIAEEQLGIDIRKKSGAKQSEGCANTTQKQA
jgi:transposase-like protein